MEDEGQDPPNTSPGYTAGQTDFSFMASSSLALISHPLLSLPGLLTSHLRTPDYSVTLLPINKDSSGPTCLMFFKKIGTSP